MLNINSVLFILGDAERMSKSGETINPTSVCLLKLKVPIEPILFSVDLLLWCMLQKNRDSQGGNMARTTATLCSWWGPCKNPSCHRTSIPRRRLRGCWSQANQNLPLRKRRSEPPSPEEVVQRFTRVFLYPEGAHRLHAQYDDVY